MKLLIEGTCGDCTFTVTSYGVGDAGELDLYVENSKGELYVRETFAPHAWQRVVKMETHESE